MLITKNANDLFDAICRRIIEADLSTIDPDSPFELAGLGHLNDSDRTALLRELYDKRYLNARFGANGDFLSVGATMIGMRQFAQNYKEYESDRCSIARILNTNKYSDEDEVHSKTGIARQLIQYHFAEFAATNDLTIPSRQERPIGVQDVKDSILRFCR